MHRVDLRSTASGARRDGARRPLVSIAPLIAASLLLLPACQSGPRNFENDNDRLRRENMELRERAAALAERIDALRTRLEIERQGRQPRLPAGARRPVTVGIELGRFSGGVDTDGDGTDDAVRLYLRPLDDLRRFVQTVGEVDVTVAHIPPGEAAATVGTARFDAKAFDEAYRSGMAGTHYTLLVPVTEAPAGATELTVRISLRDLLTGRVHEAQQAVRWTGRGGESAGG